MQTCEERSSGSRTRIYSATTAVNNQWVTLKTGASCYTLAAAKTAAAKFFLDQYEPTGTYAFYNSDDLRQVALQGPDGVLLYVVDVTSPNSNNIHGGQLMEWATFTIDNNQLGVKDRSTLTNRTWVAVQGSDGGYGIALYDGERIPCRADRREVTWIGASATTAKITPITLSLVKA